MEIEHINEPWETDTKRFHYPARTRSRCPKCGLLVEIDGTDSYLSYPTLNKPIDLHFYCSSSVKEEGEFVEKGCHHEWTRKIILRLKIEQVIEPESFDDLDPDTMACRLCGLRWGESHDMPGRCFIYNPDGSRTGVVIDGHIPRFKGKKT